MHWDTNNLSASLLAVAIVSCASPFVVFVTCGAQRRAQIRPSKFGPKFQTHTDSFSDGQKVGPKVLVQHSRVNKHWQRHAPAPRALGGRGLEGLGSSARFCEAICFNCHMHKETR